MFDQIEKLKHELTDKYVIVDAGVAELMRFDGHVGQVKTVNMNGRALVQFDAWSNIGWYDIDVDSLKVVPKPEAEAEQKKHEKAAAPTKQAAGQAPVAAPSAGSDKKLSPLEMARMQGAVKTSSTQPVGEKPAPAVGAAKKSTADVLAAARGAKAPESAPSAGKPAAPAAKMSTADLIAAARAKQTAETAASAPAPPAPAAIASAPVAPAPVASAPQTAKVTLVPGQRLSVPEILDWCRQHDAK